MKPRKAFLIKRLSLLSLILFLALIFGVTSQVVAGEIDHYYKNTQWLITKSCSGGTWQEVTEYEIPSTNFTAGKKYLIVINFSIQTGTSVDENAMARVLHGSTVFSDSTYRNETRRSGDQHCGHGYNYWTVWTAVSGEGIHVEVTQPTASAVDVRTEDYEAFVINLSDDLTEGTDWFYQAETHSGDLPTSWGVLPGIGASLTFDGGNSHWLILAFGRFLSDATSDSYLMRIYDVSAATGYSNIQYGTEDTDDYRPHMLMMGLTNVGSNHTVRVEAKNSSANTNDWSDSKIFALNLNKFQDYWSGYDTTQVSLTESGSMNWYEVYGKPDYSATQAGNVLIWSQEVADVGEDTKRIYGRIQDGVTTLSSSNSIRELPHEAYDEDAHHRIYIGSFLPGTHDIDIDMYEYGDVDGPPSIDIHSLSIFSMELADPRISGTVYTDEGWTHIGAGKTVRVKVNGGSGDYTTTDANGAYYFGDFNTNFGDVITVFLDGEAEKAVTVMLSDGRNVFSGIDLYQNRLIVRNNGAGPITDADLSQYDSSHDATNIFFEAGDIHLDLEAGKKLIILDGCSYKGGGVGGHVNLHGNGDPEPDGDIYIGAGSNLEIASGTLSFCVAGSWRVGSGATFTPNSNAVTFTAETTGKFVRTSEGFNFYDLTFNGPGGGWTLWPLGFHNDLTVTNNFTVTNGTVSSSDGVTVGNNFTITGGTVNAPGSDEIYVGNNWDVSGGTFIHNNSEVIFNATDSGNTVTCGTNGDFYDLTLNGGLGSGWTLQDDVTVTNDFSITSSTVTGPSSGTLTVGNDFTITDSTVASPGSGTLTVGDDFTIISGTATAPSSGTIYVGNNWDVTGGTFIHNNSKVIFNATDSGNMVFCGSNGDFYDLTFDGLGGSWIFQDEATVTNNFTITNGTVTGP